MRYAAVSLILLVFATLALAQTCPPVTYPSAKKVVVAEAFVPIFDVAVKDIFIFTGPPPAAPAGYVAGVTAANKELRVVPPIQPSLQSPAAPARTGALSVLIAEDAARAIGAPLSGYVEGASASPALPVSQNIQARVLAGLQPACGQCHTAGQRIRGGFTLLSGQGFAPGVSWKQVLAAVSSSGSARPAMPPSGDPLAPDLVDLIRQLASK